MKAPETKSRPSFGFRGPGGRAKGPVEKAKNFKESLKTLLKELAIYKKSLIVVVILALVGTIFNIVGPKVMGKATTVIFVGLGASLKGVGTLDYLLIGKILTFTALLYAISSLAMFLQGFILSNISQKVSQSMRTRINGKLHRLSLSSFDKTTHGEILPHNKRYRYGEPKFKPRLNASVSCHRNVSRCNCDDVQYQCCNECCDPFNFTDLDAISH